MKPYTIRERRDNLAALEREAYPGQRERILMDLIKHDAERAAAEREVAAEARHGGRALTAKLAYRVRDFESGGYVTVPEGQRLGAAVPGETPIHIAALRGDLGRDRVNRVWSFFLDASSSDGTNETRRADWRRYAQRLATGTVGVPVVSLSAAEAMLDWPIYRAAIT